MLRLAQKADADRIIAYYHKLSDQSKQRFAPHPFTRNYLLEHILEHPDYITLIKEDAGTSEIIGYSVCQLWLFDYDIKRWLDKYKRSFNEVQSNEKFACFAPSVLDAFQHAGLGSQLLAITKEVLIKKGYAHIILWGGVKCENIKAVKFYLKNGFELVGHFDYQGGNYDMLLRVV